MAAAVEADPAIYRRMPASDVPTYVIQFSCDPSAEGGSTPEVERQRYKSDQIGRSNFVHICERTVADRRRRKPSVSKLFRELAQGPPGFDNSGLSHSDPLIHVPSECAEERKVSVREGWTAAFRNEVAAEKIRKDQLVRFYAGLQDARARFHYLPLHGAHPLDWDHEYSFIELPQNVYVIGLPYNCEGLFFHSNEENCAFVELLKRPDFYSKVRRRSNEMMCELYTNLRIWVPGNVIINRALEVETTVRPSANVVRLRRQMNDCQLSLYTALIEDPSIAAPRRKKGRGRHTQRRRIQREGRIQRRTRPKKRQKRKTRNKS